MNIPNLSGTNRDVILPQSHNGRKVMVFRKDILPLSETFIRDQVDSYGRWNATLAGFRRVPGLPMNDPKLVLLDEGRWLDALRLKLIQHGQYYGMFSSGLQSLVQRIEPDLIHAHFGYDAILISDIARKLNIPLVVTLHGTDILTADSVWLSGREGQFFKRYPAKLRQLFGRCGVSFIAVSRALRDAAISRGAPPDRTEVLHTGVDSTSFTPAEVPFQERRGILFVGRLVAFKGCEFLLRAMALLKSSPLGDYPVTIIGDGPLRAELEEMARHLGVRAEFKGACARHDIRKAMQTNAVFCLPSVTDAAGCFEAFGMVILEAQASGLPVISSARGGSDAIEDGISGFIFAERDVQHLSQLILRLTQNRDIWERLSKGGRAVTERDYSIHICTKKIEDFYDRLVDEHKSTSR